MLVLLLVTVACAAPAVKNDAAVRFEAALGGPEALERHKMLLRSVLGDLDIPDPKQSHPDSPQVTGRRMSKNERAKYLYQGDILLSPSDMARMTASRSKRGAPDISKKRFDKNQPIGFVFEEGQYAIPESGRQSVRETINKIAANTCLSFKENSGKGTQLNFIRDVGCWSQIGESPDSKGLQDISLSSMCERIPAQITHEIFHALGLGHTLSRYDRDLYVTIHQDRIIKSSAYNLDKLTKENNNNFGVPYEYGSIMHYASTGLAIVPGQRVIEAKEDFYYEVMGQRTQVTYNDYRLINALYNCSSHCPKQMACQNGGYPSPKDCNACVCPEFYSGTNCQTPKNLISLTASSPSGKTTFHQDQDPATQGTYKAELYGHDGPKVIRAPEGRRIRVTLSRMSVNWGKIRVDDCELLDIEIRDGPGGDLTSLGKHFCDPSKLEGFSFVSQGNVVGYKASTSPGFNMDIEINYSLV